MKQYIFLLAGLAFALTTYAQNPSAYLKKREVQYQDCLDKGVGMASCASDFYNDIDSLLNVVYQQLRGKKNEAEKITLRNEQRAWLVKRDKYFYQLDVALQKKVTKGDYGTEDTLMVINNKAEFVKSRVEELIKKLSDQ